eukprot:m.135245 g.135245  ORF g.135245 m.135245 type:complete len:495 (+) comp38158_c0_seq1:107-1591(+)
MKQMKCCVGWIAVIYVASFMGMTRAQSSRPVQQIANPIRKVCWSDWLDRDDPTGTGDFETLGSFLRERKPICQRPLDIRCRAKSTRKDARTTGEYVVCNKSVGFSCQNSRQYDGRCNFDYEVSFLCPCQDRCYRLFAPRYGSLKTTTYHSLTADNVKSYAQFHCLPGFKLIGPATKSCRLQRNYNSYTFDWYPNSRPPYCRPACPFPYPKNPDGGHVQVSNIYGSWTASYSCKEGFTLAGDAESKCISGGSWTNEEPKCHLSALVKMNNLDNCSFSDNLNEADGGCLYVNSDKNSLDWKQEIYSEGLLQRTRAISKARLPGTTGDCSESETEETAPKSRKGAVEGLTFRLVIFVFPFRFFEVKTAEVSAGPFVHPKADFRSLASYIRFRLTAQTALMYAIEAHVICVPKGHIDPIGSIKDEFKAMSLVIAKPPTGDYCFNFEDTVDPVDCKKFAILLRFSMQYTQGRRPLQLRVTPLGVGRKRHCNRAKILNQA